MSVSASERPGGRAGRANPGACVSSVIGQFLTVMRLESWTGRLGRRVGVANGEDRCWERERREVELPFGSQIRSYCVRMRSCPAPHCLLVLGMHSRCLGGQVVVSVMQSTVASAIRDGMEWVACEPPEPIQDPPSNQSEGGDCSVERTLSVTLLLLKPVSALASHSLGQ